MQHGFTEWAVFGGILVAMLALDLGVFHRKDHTVGTREALAWSAVWVALAIAFGGWIAYRHGTDAGLEYLTGYLIEKSLSVDNIFVFVVIFGALGIPALYQHRVLFWGILSALVLRGAMIAGGAALLHRFEWLVYVFGAFLVLTGVKLFASRHAPSRPEQGVAYRVLTRVIPSTTSLDGNRFVTVERGKRLATPLLLALAMIEVTDVLFAVDSIPAIFAVTRDPYLVFTSNIFALLGLRSLYFLLAGVVKRFRYLEPSLAAVLVFVGVKMTLVDVVPIHPVVSLGVVLVILATGVGASIIAAPRQPRAASAIATTPGWRSRRSTESA